MPSRRSVLGIIVRTSVFTASFIGLGLGRVTRVLAASGKRILNKNTDPATLIYEKPENLDTTDFPVMPVEDFGTMGDTEIDVDLGSWRLEVGGEVERPRTYTYAEILSLPAVEREVLLICPGVFVNHGRWKGVAVRELIRRSEPKAGTRQVVIYGRTRTGEQRERFGFAELEGQGLLLAYAVNGKDLPVRHGRPLRLVAGEHMGYRWTKFVTRIEVSADPD